MSSIHLRIAWSYVDTRHYDLVIQKIQSTVSYRQLVIRAYAELFGSCDLRSWRYTLGFSKSFHESLLFCNFYRTMSIVSNIFSALQMFTRNPNIGSSGFGHTFQELQVNQRIVLGIVKQKIVTIHVTVFGQIISSRSASETTREALEPSHFHYSCIFYMRKICILQNDQHNPYATKLSRQTQQIFNWIKG